VSRLFLFFWLVVWLLLVPVLVLVLAVDSAVVSAGGTGGFVSTSCTKPEGGRFFLTTLGIRSGWLA
jgi:hypothetical protein